MRTSSDELRNKLKLKNFEVKRKFAKKHPSALAFLKEKGLDLGSIRKHSAKIIGAGALTGTLLLAPPIEIPSLPNPSEVIEKIKLDELVGLSPQEFLVSALNQFLPGKVRPLIRDEEKKLEQLFQSTINISVKGTLEGEHLNTTYGYIGAEQHLRRYPGDTLTAHGSGVILQEGMAPGLGAWGYFASSKTDLTPDLEETEKWYAVVQTLYLPDWEKRLPYLRNWYKYRKVLIIDVENGNAVVASIADSGPAIWTGKNFGGSPEVMYYLGGPRYKKGKVLLFFVDDPENKIPLGPVEYNEINLPEISLFKS
ncbi:MAG: hypothetical protein AAB685_01075 [Patescibacteria group bacterium]